MADIARCVQDAQFPPAVQPRGDFRAETSSGQPQIQDRKIRLVALAEFDPLLDGASDAAHFIPTLDQNIFEHVGHHEVVFGNHHLEHLGYLFRMIAVAIGSPFRFQAVRDSLSRPTGARVGRSLSEWAVYCNSDSISYQVRNVPCSLTGHAIA